MTTTRLHIGAAQSEVRSAAAVLQLAIGAAATAAAHPPRDTACPRDLDASPRR